MLFSLFFSIFARIFITKIGQNRIFIVGCNIVAFSIVGELILGLSAHHALLNEQEKFAKRNTHAAPNTVGAYPRVFL